MTTPEGGAIPKAGPETIHLPIVGIGASAGGIEAFQGFFANMPPDSGMAFVVILHLPPDRKSMLPEILGRWTSMPIIEAGEGCLVEANHVYVPPAGVVVTLRDGRLHPHKPGLNEPREPTPIDLFFDSMATELAEDAIGIVLSGTGSDGALGLKSIKARGGLTLAQGGAPMTGSIPAQHGGMPASAIATGAVDIVAPVELMPGRILAVREAHHALTGPAEPPIEQTEAARLAICDLLRRQLGHDFTGYKEKTFMRRVQRRMQVLSLTQLQDYVVRLEIDSAEIVMLFRDLLIGVTSFFRDTEIFEVLERTVIPMLFAGKGVDDTIRVWVPGCASGEEAYSLAMLLREHADGIAGPVPRLQVFATDIDEPAIAIARAGRYPLTLLRGLSPARLARFFVKGSDATYTKGKEIREICTFSAHSLTRDPPFSRVDLVSCRNLLIYLDNDLQAAVIPAFHYALVPNGILLLGKSETVSRYENLFAAVDRSHRIFRRRNVRGPPLRITGQLPMPNDTSAPAKSAPVLTIAPGAAARMSTRAGARILERFAPAFVVVGTDGQILQFSSRIGRFLEPAPGSPSQNVLVMVRRGLRSHLAEALKKAVSIGRLVETAAVSMTLADDATHRVSLAVEPLAGQGAAPHYLVVFVEAGPKPEGRAEPAHFQQPETGFDAHLEAELRDTHEQLQAVTEEHETALEELRSANEEMHSVNEELQSANEELETSKEEIQSINEELQTVNSQLAGKVEELDVRNTDLRNLFESTEVATVFLDAHLVVRRFTPAVASIYNLIPGDVGRPLTDIVSRLRYSGLRDDVHHVLATLEPLDRRVARDDDSAHYLMRILPYRAPESAVDGTIVTFVDVTSIVQAEQHQRLLVDELNHRVKNMLTVVISLATQTIRRSDTMEEFSANYLGRIHALTAAYSLLSHEHWQTVPLRDIIFEELKPFMAADGSNILVNGPLVPLQSRAALSFGMAIHELTTNAVKYGALSVPDGSVSIDWRIETEPDGDHLVLEWAERGGPPVVAPPRRGFGLTLIERGLRHDMGAEVKMEFAPDGVRARLRAPLHATIALSEGGAPGEGRAPSDGGPAPQDAS